MVVGKTLAEHDANLKKVLDRVREIDMTLNKEKCQFRLTQIDYLGETLSQEGVKPDNQKIKTILEYRTPECKADGLSLLGMVNFIAKFAPKVSELTTPLSQLTKKHVAFHWEQVHEKAFNDLKSLLSNPDCLRYYDVKKPVTLQVDASHDGVGAALIQDEGPVAYASKAMNETQQRWAQIEKELFAVLFACKRFQQYVYGKPVTVESDHGPLEFVFRKPLSQAPP